MPGKVLDSWALIAFFEDEPGADAVEALIHQATLGRHRLYLTVLQWAEVYYITMREVSKAAAEARVGDIATLPIEIVGVEDDLKLTRLAAVFKASHKLSLAGAFAAAVAHEKKAELVTGDPEFGALEKVIGIGWLR